MVEETESGMESGGHRQNWTAQVGDSGEYEAAGAVLRLAVAERYLERRGRAGIRQWFKASGKRWRRHMNGSRWMEPG
ncbi:hypothetical protein FH972_023174 [Carpinus fangiana]|uniref:Uncharacterized protein n=1 Tax=Carpinus fangiana TaxID=176857 RepID=A0A5N6KUE2_9ROSI|nr:hypothetical protein FH972_023174 [Carpinus fangiana]